MKNHLVRILGSTSISNFEGTRFFRGNGEKIFRRAAKIVHFMGETLNADDLVWLIRNRPSLRRDCFNALARHDHPNRYFCELVDLFRRDTFVDDATFVYMSNFCLHARFRRNAKFEKQIIELVQYFQLRKEYFPIYCSIILASKFLTPAEIITLIEQTKVAWDQDFWLGRSVGGLTPRVLTDIAATNSFNRITQSVNNSDLDDVVGFHHRLRTDLSAVNRLLAYAKNENPTYPQKTITLNHRSFCRFQ